MKSKRILLGLLAITLVFGMMSCKEDKGEEPAKKLKITGIPDTVKTPYVEVYLLDDDANFVAGGYAITSSTVTIALKQATETGTTVNVSEEDWKGTGTYYIILLESTGEGGIKFSEMTAYDIYDVEFKNETTTVAFGDFNPIDWDSVKSSIKLNISVK
jgi:hypothetical protein